MAAKSNKQKRLDERDRLVKIRDLEPGDGMELIGIIAAAGANPQVGRDIGLALAALQQKPPNLDVALQAGGGAVLAGIYAALRNRDAREDMEAFLYNIWAPPLGPIKGDSEEERAEDERKKKEAAFKKLGLEGYGRIIDGFRQTEDFGDFLDWLRSTFASVASSGESLIPSSETTDSAGEQ